MPDRSNVQRALADGTQQSLRACSRPADEPLPARLWRRHRWTIIGALLLVLVELIGLGTAIGGGMNHF